MTDPFRFDFMGPDDYARHEDDLAAMEDDARYEGDGMPLFVTNCPACHYNYRFCRCEPKRQAPKRMNDSDYG